MPAPDAAAPAPWPAENLLRQETSPYLLQHAANPVHWRPWGAAAFAEARARGVPVLLSVGYAACHWCHVMAHESFEDPATAAAMNRHFVNIKLDREERPDLDQIYQHALALLGQQGGWPLTMFLDADGHPFWGGTYFPPGPRWGRPGFVQVLEAIARVHAEEPDRVAQNVGALSEALAGLALASPGAGITAADREAGAHELLAAIDPREGGLAGAPKFPQASLFAFLWQQGAASGAEPAFRAAVTLTLARMSQGGIHDHVGGGFARYSTDARWLVPHFEKMLYDNAQLLELLAAAWVATRAPLFAARAAGIVEWLLAEMRGPADAAGDAAFAAALDADSEGEEGRFYVWSAAEIAAVLGPDAPRFAKSYDVTLRGNWEGRVILNRSADPGWAGAETEAFFDRCLAALRAARALRPRPARDDKLLADWNGLAIAALARAGAAFDRPDWIEAARSAFRFLGGALDAGPLAGAAPGAPGRRLFHAWAGGRARHPGLLEDYAAMARAGIALFEAAGDEAALAAAQGWVAAADALCRDADGAYLQAPRDAADVIVRVKSAHDHATPSGNGLMAEVLARLHHLTGAARWREAAEALIAAFAGEAGRAAILMPRLAMASALLEDAIACVIAGAPDDPATEALLRAARAADQPLLVLQRVALGRPPPISAAPAPAARRSPIPPRSRPRSPPAPSPRRRPAERSPPGQQPGSAGRAARREQAGRRRRGEGSGPDGDPPAGCRGSPATTGLPGVASPSDRAAPPGLIPRGHRRPPPDERAKRTGGAGRRRRSPAT